MPDIWMDVDAAVTVPCNKVPLIDSTDGVTIEDNTVAYDATGIEVYWNFVTTAGAITCTPITPTTGGDYDWAHVDGGMYKIEIPASAGASANNDTEGFGWITGKADGVLPFAGPVIGFRAAGLNNLLVDTAYSATRGLAGTALPDAAADAAGGVPVSDAGALDLDALNADVASILADTGTDGVVVASNTAAAKAEINAEVVDALGTDTIAEMAQGIPTATPTIKEALMYLFMAWRNETLRTANLWSVKNNAGTVICKATISDDGTTFTKAEFVSGA